jgi:hypothetical protein
MRFDRLLTVGDFLPRVTRRGRRHPARAHGVAVVASLRLHSGARSEVARPTHCAHFVRYVQTTVASQFTKRADARRPRPCAHQSPTNRPRRVPPAARATVGSFHPKEPEVSAKACPGRLRSACEAPSSAGLVARARSALRQLTCRRLFEGSERSERSELGDGPRDRAAQGSRSEAQAAEPKRSSLPGHAFAAPADRA